MPRRRATSRIALVCLTALATGLAGCKGASNMFDESDGGWFSKPVDAFKKPDWARPVAMNTNADLGPKGPVGPNDLVGADGSCFAPAEAAPAVAAAPPADKPVGSVAGDLAGAPMAAGAPAPAARDPGMPAVLGGIALGMTECQAVQRAGNPTNVAMGGGGAGERSVVLTYLSGPWPGIYRFSDGRLKVVERAPAPPEPPKATPKKKIAKKPAQKPQT